MPRYLIERTYTVDMDALPTVATRSKAIGHHRYPEIVWEHSHVVVDSEGNPKSFCVYAAPSEEMVREHAGIIGVIHRSATCREIRFQYHSVVRCLRGLMNEEV